MEGAGRLFFMASVFYLAVGTFMGLAMAFLRGKWTLRLMPAHVHINLLGWVSMLIFGFAYTFLPALAGRELYSTRLPYVHFVVANIGLPGMAAVWVGSRFPGSRIPPRLVWPFGGLVAASVWIRVFNMAMGMFRG